MKYPIYLLLLLIMGACHKAEPCDLMIHNARIHTLDEDFSVVEAMVIHEGKILDTGSAEALLKRYKPRKKVRFSGDVHIYPGFNDAHAHYLGYAEGLRKVDLRGTASWTEVLERLQAFAEEHQPDYIEGRGWDHNRWPQKEYPDRRALDSLFPHTPVLLRRIDGHAAVANQAALERAGISPSTSVNGGDVEQRKGRLTGILIDNALELIEVPPLPEGTKIGALREAEEKLFAAGVTSVTDAGLQKEDILLIERLQEMGALRIRVNAMVSDDSTSLNYFLERGAIQKEKLRVQSAKFYLDGALGSRGALLLEPYADRPGQYGLQLTDTAHLIRWGRRLKEAGWQMAVHAIGDSANRLATDIYTRLLQGDTTARWRIEHAQVVHPTDRAKMARAGIIPSVQPTHAVSDGPWAPERLGARMDRAYPYRSLWECCGPLPLGTDFPVEEINPLHTLRAAVYRQDTAGKPQGGFQPGEKLPFERALRGMTHVPAWAAFEDSIKGRLIPGHLADFVVMSSDLRQLTASELATVRPVSVYLDGKQVY